MQGDFDLPVARAWLNTPTVSSVTIGSLFQLIIIPQNSIFQKLKAADPNLAQAYNDCIKKVQEIVEVVLHDFERVVEQKEKEHLETIWLEEERKQKEEEWVAAIEAARKEKEEFIQKMRDLAQEAPDLLASANFHVSNILLSISIC